MKPTEKHKNIHAAIITAVILVVIFHGIYPRTMTYIPNKAYTSNFTCVIRFYEDHTFELPPPPYQAGFYADTGTYIIENGKIYATDRESGKSIVFRILAPWLIELIPEESDHNTVQYHIQCGAKFYFG